ncbi:DMT family transporter [Roseomonas terrae]|jgi:drug/metabolite transporter (DMT)-like permease|uniref:DMT family transporter n=1 Tax=Neoroseomonas terrae TaxID=424799 RepID=A0ABS5EGQ1_9PROT|nr:DMT family transporter [Neoroseomonas terrae]MBR0650208.1 DMT family transporter [Neoroseomonas terrae]
MTTTLSPLGIAAGLAASTIWGGAIAVTRLGVSGEASFGPADIAMLRFAVPALLLLPVLRRAWPRLRQVSPWLLALLLGGGGAPFVLIVGSGLSVAGTAEAGALLPGTVPLCVALVSALMGERISSTRVAGLAMIALAVATVVLPAIAVGGGAPSLGHLLLLLAALLAAGYTIALRRSGIGPWEAAAFVSAGSVAGLGPFYLLTMEPAVLAMPLHDVAVQAVFQGIASGILAPVAFAAAVQRLGASKAAAFGSLSPGAACLGGFALLGEMPDGLALVAVLISCIGVALATRTSGAPLRIWPATQGGRTRKCQVEQGA